MIHFKKFTIDLLDMYIVWYKRNWLLELIVIRFIFLILIIFYIAKLYNTNYTINNKMFILLKQLLEFIRKILVNNS